MVIVGGPFRAYTRPAPVHHNHKALDASGITFGPLFRSVNRHGQLQAGRLSDTAVAWVVKRVADAAGVSERAIMAQTGHKSVSMVRREGSLFRDNAAAGVGL